VRNEAATCKGFQDERWDPLSSSAAQGCCRGVFRPQVECQRDPYHLQHYQQLAVYDAPCPNAGRHRRFAFRSWGVCQSDFSVGAPRSMRGAIAVRSRSGGLPVGWPIESAGTAPSRRAEAVRLIPSAYWELARSATEFAILANGCFLGCGLRAPANPAHRPCRLLKRVHVSHDKPNR
jgi:hypothetical protein